jgi:hypothetical protein
VALNRLRSHGVVSSWSPHATNSARTVASTLVGGVLRIWLSRSSCFIFFNTNSTCHLARYPYSTSAADHVAASRVVMSNRPPATARVGAVSVRPAFWALRR